MGYYDDFTNQEDLAKYGEVFEKQRNVDAVKEKEEGFGRGVFVGFTFGKNSAPCQYPFYSLLLSATDSLTSSFHSVPSRWPTQGRGRCPRDYVLRAALIYGPPHYVPPFLIQTQFLPPRVCFFIDFSYILLS